MRVNRVTSIQVLKKEIGFGLLTHSELALIFQFSFQDYDVTLLSFYFRTVLEVGVLIWSVATALVPFLGGYMPGLLLTRVLVSNFLLALLPSCILSSYSADSMSLICIIPCLVSENVIVLLYLAFHRIFYLLQLVSIWCFFSYIYCYLSYTWFAFIIHFQHY